MLLVSLLSYFAAIFFPLSLVYLILMLDIFDTGKVSTVVIFVLWGLSGAFFTAYFLNTYVMSREGYDFTVLRSAPCLEEICKAGLLVYFIRSHRFHYFIDGAVYGFAAGIGFAIAENVFYVSNSAEDTSLNLAVIRTLSATLMHGTASATIGIALGLTRRMSGWRKWVLPFLGFILAVTLHALYNNILFRSEGYLLLMAGIGIGCGGGLIIFIFIDQGQIYEKRHLEKTLGIVDGKAIQHYGDDTLNAVLKDAALYFGEDKARLIKQYLILQANIGILKSNLALPVSERLASAWKQEINVLHLELERTQQQLGIYVITFFLRNLVSDSTPEFQQELTQRILIHEPHRLHAFDLFITQSKLAHQIDASALETRTALLSQTSIFKNLPLVDLENLSRAITEQSYDTGGVLFEHGDQGDAMYIIQQGRVEAQTQGVSHIFERGDVLGEIALLDAQPRSARVVALEDTKVLVLNREHFMLFVQSRPRVILAVLHLIAGRVRQATQSVEMGILWARYLAEGKFDKAQEIALDTGLEEFLRIAIQLEERNQYFTYKTR